MKAIYFSEFGPVSKLQFLDLPTPVADDLTAIVQVAAGSINPSDVKNIEGKMEHTTLPRIPGRDFAGIVLQGPAEWTGKAVWGTGGEIGYSVNGSHAEQIAVPVASLREKPANLTFAQAAVIGTTYLAAWLAVMEYGQLQSGETLLVIGAGGGVGGSAAQIGHWRGARVIGVAKQELPENSPAIGKIDTFYSIAGKDVSEIPQQATGGKGANVVFDTVGGAMFEPALSALAHRGRLVEISSLGERPVSFGLLDFYHNESQLFGADTRKRDATASAALLDGLKPQFESGVFAAPRIDRVIALSEGSTAYQQMAAGTARGRLVLASRPELASATEL